LVEEGLEVLGGEWVIRGKVYVTDGKGGRGEDAYGHGLYRGV
jgi:hypothetical protein